MNWHDIHVYYYANNDPLIRHAIRPLFRRLSGQVPAMYYTRHWLRGPHLRLSLRTGAGTLARVVRPAVEEIVGGFLAEQPSRLRVDPAQRLRTHQRLAELEHESGPLLPWHADNSIHHVAHDRRLHVLGSEDAAELLTDFHTDATELAFDMTERIATGGQRARLAFDLMVATAHAMSGGGILSGFGSLRSHAEGALHGFAEATGLRPAWEQWLRRHLRSLAGRASAVVATVDGDRAAMPLVREWLAVLGSARRRAGRLLAEGRLTTASMFPLDDGAEAKRYMANSSPFHREMLSDPDWPRIKSSERFTLYRLMLNYTYLYLTRIGVTPLERFLLCHLAAGAVEAHYGISAMEAYERFWKTSPAAGLVEVARSASELASEPSNTAPPPSLRGDGLGQTELAR